MRRLVAAVAALAAVAAVCALQADAARKATPAETKGIDATLQKHWCDYLPKGYGPCSAWHLKLTVKNVSTGIKGWALAQIDATGPQPMSTTFAPFQNVFLHESNDGSWTDRGWFDSLVYRTCKAAARGTKVPEEVLDEFGLCDRLIFTIGG
jgi:hypothetical protein